MINVELQPKQSDNQLMNVTPTDAQPMPAFLWKLFMQLRQRQFQLSPVDYLALRAALQAGFGWSSQQELRSLCCCLWAKSSQEYATISSLFDRLLEQYGIAEWDTVVENVHSQLNEDQQEPRLETAGQSAFTDNNASTELAQSDNAPDGEVPMMVTAPGLPPLLLDAVTIPKRPFIFMPQYPVSYRQVVQAWRRLRQPVRRGPAIELDVDGTIEQRCRQGIATTAVLQPRRCNEVKLLLLIDRQGSMYPFHAYVDMVCNAICRTGNIGKTAVYYFHDVPAVGADETALSSILMDGGCFDLETVISEIAPFSEGDVFKQQDLSEPVPLDSVLDTYAADANVVMVSDVGAARGRTDTLRLLDTLAFFKALRQYTVRAVILNPVPQYYWKKSTAEYITRHLPMYPLDAQGMYRAVHALRTQSSDVEFPL